MGNRHLFRIIAATLAFVVAPIGGLSQVYQFSTAVSGGPYGGPYGWTEVDLSFGVDSTGSGGHLNFGTLNETLYYDPVANTLRQVGTVSFSPSEFSFNIVGGFAAPGSYGSADLTVPGGTLAFDTTGPFVLNSVLPWNLYIPITGMVSVVYVGNGYTNTYNGPVSYSFPLYIGTHIYSLTPQSLSLEENQFSGSSLGVLVNAGDITLSTSTSDGSYYHTWSVPMLTAMEVPEPGNVTIFACAFLALFTPASLNRARSREAGYLGGAE